MSPGAQQGAQIAQQRVCFELRQRAQRRERDLQQNNSSANNSEPTQTSVSHFHDQLIAERNSSRNGDQNSRTGTNVNHRVIMDEYLALPLLQWSADPLLWWRIKKRDGSLGCMGDLARQFLCIPATSVPSEQLFSDAEILLPKNEVA